MMNQFINSKTSMKRLQFGTTKCVKLHVGKTQNEILCQKLSVGGWKVEVTTDTHTLANVHKINILKARKKWELKVNKCIKEI